MTEAEQKAVHTIITTRQESAYNRLKNDPRYLKICERQIETDNAVEELYHLHFTYEERIVVRRHYDGETEKNALEADEVYFQGLKDCFKFLIHLGILSKQD